MASRTPRRPAAETPIPDASALDQQLLISGAFSPLLWLLDTGQLAYGDYERWRLGQLETLDAVLAPQCAALLLQLKGLTQQAVRLGLVSEPQHYYAWGGDGAGASLRLSGHSELAAALGQHWTRPADRMQLDLFMDNSLTVAENQLCDALAAKQWDPAEQACQRLARLAPAHGQLAGYEGLIAYGRHLQAHPVIDPASLLDEWHGLQREVIPLAQELLRQQARDYLAPAWRRLAQAQEALPYDPAQPDLHASHAWAQLPDWPRVIAAIRATAGWERDTTLMQRLARATQHSQPEVAALLYCTLWQLDKAFAQARFSDGTLPASLRQHWQTFNELEEELPGTLFPAYLLIREPGLLHAATSTAVPRFSHSAFLTTLELLECRRRGQDEILQRQALKEASPTLLRLYLQSKVAMAGAFEFRS